MKTKLTNKAISKLFKKWVVENSFLVHETLLVTSNELNDPKGDFMFDKFNTVLNHIIIGKRRRISGIKVKHPFGYYVNLRYRNYVTEIFCSEKVIEKFK